MALAHTQMHRTGTELRSRPELRHRGRDTLAEVVPIRPEQPPRRSGLAGTVTRIAQVFASLRLQATAEGSPPRSPSSPLSHPPTRHATPDDAA